MTGTRIDGQSSQCGQWACSNIYNKLSPCLLDQRAVVRSVTFAIVGHGDV